MTNIWDAFQVLFWFIGLALLFHGWPSFGKTEHHYHYNDEEDCE